MTALMHKLNVQNRCGTPGHDIAATMFCNLLRVLPEFHQAADGLADARFRPHMCRRKGNEHGQHLE